MKIKAIYNVNGVKTKNTSPTGSLGGKAFNNPAGKCVYIIAVDCDMQAATIVEPIADDEAKLSVVPMKYLQIIDNEYNTYLSPVPMLKSNEAKPAVFKHDK